MNRRHFLTAAATAAAPVAMGAQAGKEEEGPALDWQQVQSHLHYTAFCERAPNGEYPDIRLEIGLKRSDPEAPSSTRLELFKFTWEGRSIPIPERFWKDLTGLAVETYPGVDFKNLSAKQAWRLQQQLNALKKPRLHLSAESGTVLVEWMRSEECDSCSTIRWIISKNGTVLRHRHEPHHEC
ncbi:hypothetical protein [Luteolibacter sp. LG18]|uniref:hypothetical protein n=1 Tax=Luteolibacter sp. LG18 TaxID=2819286 RepID=UPI002B29004E|nr:hypothetical protein llg_36310 [Luteolibacter sp. LG18]